MERESVASMYTENDRSMLKYLYDCVFFIVRKPAEQLINGDQTPKNGQIEDSLQTKKSTWRLERWSSGQIHKQMAQ